MIIEPKIYTVESVTSGHPDKVCDQISDAILDACLKEDQNSRVAVETFGGHGLIVLGGEITTSANPDFEKIAREVYKNIGYTDTPELIMRIVKQSPDIAQGVDTGGAGDQGIMYGYATDETEDRLPFGIKLVHDLTSGLEKLRKSQVIDYLLPDGKAQITINNGKIISVLISAQHKEGVDQAVLKNDIIEKLIKPIIGDLEGIEVLVNPTGIFLQGGFEADTGLTGRKLMVDTYGGLFPHGGGAFSGKDATKVDRSAAYMCRWVAKNLVDNNLAKKALVSVAYAIGRSEPLMVEALNEKGESLMHLIKDKFDFKPKAIIEQLGLKQAVYARTASYGHFGKADYPWEKNISLK